MLNGLKRLTGMIFRRNSYRMFNLIGTKVDYLSKVGDGTGSSTVTAPLNWIATTFPEAPPALWRQREDSSQEDQVRDHPLLRLMQRPNPFHTGLLLWMATVTDYKVDGNAYWLKLRDRNGSVRELWWTPSWMLTPKSADNDKSVYIKSYEYQVDGERYSIDPEDIVHFRNGLDPDDPRLGRSQLKSVLREVYTDDEAALFTATILGNMGVPGLVVSPEKGTNLNDGDIEYTKSYVKELFAGDRRGEPMVMSGATQIAQFGFSPEQLLLRELRRIPEERVTAVMGVPAIVAGLGAGLDRSTFTNMAEAREAAYESGIIPMQRILSEEIRFQLLSDFEDDVFDWRFGFDLSKVRVLQEDLYRQAQRNDLAVRGGWAMVSEARRPMGYEVDEGRDNVFLRPLNVATVPASEASAPVVKQSASNGNGALSAEVVQGVADLLDRRALVTG